VRHNLFLAFKEALNNVVRHAEASEVRMTLTLLPREFRIALADNGRGFELGARNGSVPASAPATGNGLSNMRQRIEAIGGQFTVESQPGRGATVTFTLPAPHAC
jgi:signal transduction histidine kinase